MNYIDHNNIPKYLISISNNDYMKLNNIRFIVIHFVVASNHLLHDISSSVNSIQTGKNERKNSMI